ncbi:MAG: SpoVA/SpoVAEb family sporulation membrane protein, partial [Clostridia bacterium]|nr:SpoVA/SpoVAEb family sporulation membrane protein [Clostridia bacterium]
SMEFKTEGYVYGVASKMFVIAGPIIVFGIASSVLVGLVYYGIYNLF